MGLGIRLELVIGLGIGIGIGTSTGWGPFLSKELTGRINAFLKRAFRYGFATEILEVNSLLDSASKDLFCNIQIGLTIVYLVSVSYTHLTLPTILRV